MVISKTKRPVRTRRVRVYVRAWRVRIPDIPQGTAPAETRPRALSITAPSGGAGAQSLSGATVSEASAPVEEARRRRLFYIVETVRGRERWRSGPLHDHVSAVKYMADRAFNYIAQGYESKRGHHCITVRNAGVTIEIRIIRDAKAVAA